MAGVVITLHKEQCPENQLKCLFDLAQSLANNPPKFFMVIYEDCVFEFNTVRALCKTINHEWENCQTKTISLINQPRKNLAKTICYELVFGGFDLDVIYEKDNRKILMINQEESKSVYKPYIEEGCWIVTGGGRGVTAECLKALASKKPQKFLLLGRSKIKEEPAAMKTLVNEKDIRDYIIKESKLKNIQISPKDLKTRTEKTLNARIIQKNIKALKNLGSTVLYRSIDCQNLEFLEKEINKIRKELGPIRGIIHAAGIKADALIGKIDDKKYKQVFSTKVKVLKNLLISCQHDKLKYLITFSSVAASFGNKGQSIYAMANEYMSQIMRYEITKRPQTIIRSIHWGPWDGGMVDQGLKKQFLKNNIPLLSLSQGANAFVNELKIKQNKIESIIAQKPGKSFLKKRKKYSVIVDSSQHSKKFILEDHAINGKKIIPLAYICEQIISIYSHIFTQTHDSFFIKDLTVFRPVLTSQSLLVELSFINKKSTWSVKISKIDRLKTPCFEMKIINFSNTSQPKQRYQKITANNFYPVVYDGVVLFHGKSFQYLTEYSLVSKNTIMTRFNVKNTKANTNTIILDLAFQTALVCAREILGHTTVPMGFEGLKTYQKTLPTQGYIVAQITTVSGETSKYTLTIIDKNKETAAIIDYALLVNYSSKQINIKNKLSLNSEIIH